MNRASSAFVAGLLLFLGACGHPSGHHGQHAAGDESHASGPQLTLDDGKKWQADEHTRLSAARLAELVAGSGRLDSVEDARALGKSLDEELEVLVKGCTMTGPAHDQLHVFLVALFPQVEALQAGTDVESLRAARAEIGSLLAAYDLHFE